MAHSVFKYLALGDSYTKGEAVESTKSFPALLSRKIEKKLGILVETKIIAVTGWRTDELIDAITKEFKKANKEEVYDFVTLLIGVNNQYQNKNFSVFKEDFKVLLKETTKLVGGDRDKVLILSIPDYAFTPLGKKNVKISKEIDVYNNFASKTAELHKISFLNITDITRQGIIDPELVAKDNLHISAKAYKQIAERISELKFKE